MSVAASIEPIAPRKIGPYELLYEIGRGGMGIVYRAAKLDDGSQVALKIASEEMADHFGFIRREIQTLRRLRHPGVVHILDEGTDRGVPWYAMELLDSRSLDQLLGLTACDADATDSARPFIPASGVLPPDLTARILVRGDLPRALTLMYRLARVLAHIHAHGIVHRDVKPQNVLVRAGDRPVLVDFGLMGRFRAHSGREVLEIAGQMLGTAVYASPEQASGELVDARADLYSFGTMLYEIVTGAPPFSGDSVQEVLLEHLTRIPTRPSMLVHGVPPVLDDLIMRLLEKRRADRLGYAEDAATLLVEAGAEPDPDFETETASYLYRPEIVGRRETLDALRSRIPAIRHGRGAFIVIGGESGIGKTSVAATFAREATMSYLNVTAGECIPVATSGEVIGGQAMHPLRPLFRAIADHCRAEGEAAIERVLGPRLAVLRDQEPSLEALVPLRTEDTPHIPPEIASRRLFSDVGETLAAFAREKPLVVVIDDLQWADEVTLRFLSSLDAEFLAAAPLLILGTYRADEVGADLRTLLERQHVVKMPLRRLDDESVHAIVRSMLAAPDAPKDFLHFLAQQSEGNPFFVAEYLRAAVAERLLVRESGRWQVQPGVPRWYGSLDLPGTVRDLVTRRLQSLSPLAARVAEAAAVLGREVDESLLIAACGESEADAQTAIADLLESYVFDPADHGVRFAHDKLREAAYALLAPERRAVLHARAAGAIEARGMNDEHAATLAHHWEVAGNPAKAIHYYAVAGQNAVSSGACREAKELITRAFALDDAQVRSDAEPPVERAIRRARWHRLLASACFGLGDLVRTDEQARLSLATNGVPMPRTTAGWRARLLLEIAQQALHLVLPRRLYRASAAKAPVLVEIASSAEKLSECSFFTTDETAMLATGMLAVNAAERLPEAAGVVRVYATLGLFSGGAGLHRLADHYFAEGRRRATALHDTQGLAYLGYATILHCVTTCEWERAARVADEARACARLCGDDQVMEIVETCRAYYEFHIGEVQKSIETYTAIREAAHKRSNGQHEAWAHNGIGRALILMGRFDEALQCLRTAQRLLEGHNDQITQVICLAHTASALLHMGQLDAAVEAADSAYALASRTNPTMFEVLWGFSVPAEVYLEVWARARGNDRVEAERMRHALNALIRTLHGHASRAPIIRPVPIRLTGIAECLDRNLRRGAKLLRKSAATASQLGLPLQEGMALYDLMRHAALDPRERAVCRERAREIFRRTGCELYLRKMATL